MGKENDKKTPENPVEGQQKIENTDNDEWSARIPLVWITVIVAYVIIGFYQIKTSFFGLLYALFWWGGALVIFFIWALFCLFSESSQENGEADKNEEK